MDAIDMFRMMLDPYSAKILQLTAPKAMNALELSDALGIPIAACYRRIRLLKDAGILREEGRVVSIGGKTVATYRSSVESVQVNLIDGRLSVTVQADGEEKSDEVDLLAGTTILHWQANDRNGVEE
jgi:DNA-binding Lrp family transcriptional regulator